MPVYNLMESLRLRFFGGVDEIGGNKILLESGEGRVFLDFGVSFNLKRRFFGGYLKPRTVNLLYSYILTGLIPRIRGIYREDLLKLDSNASRLLEGGEEIEVDGCVISHAHLDHYGHLSLLSPEIKVYVGATTLLLMRHRELTRSARGVESQTTYYKDAEDGEKREREIRVFRTGDVFEAGGVRFRPIHIDHSIPAAYGFVAETPEGVVAYTGDFRMHGPKAFFTYDFIEAARGADLLLIEATRIDEERKVTESMVAEELSRWVSGAEGRLVAVLMSEMDFDRLNSVVKAAENSGRTLILSARLMEMLQLLRKSAANIQVPDLGDAAVYLERRGSGSYDLEKDYKGWMLKALTRFQDMGISLIKGHEISKNQGRYLLIFTKPESILELTEINPLPGSLLILSTSEPHNEEQEIEREKLLKWASLFGMDVRSSHASGHAERDSIIRLVREIGPRYVIPIHTEASETFNKLVQRSVPGVKPLTPFRGMTEIP